MVQVAHQPISNPNCASFGGSKLQKKVVYGGDWMIFLNNRQESW